MAGQGVVCDGLGGGDSSNHNRKPVISSQDPSLDCVFMPSPSKISLGSGAMLRFGRIGGGNGSGKTSFRSFDHEESGDEYLDEYFNQPEKKRRLSVDQVQFLERSFEPENKLEPERKIQLAKELGLQPRQIAVWFQNRRARWKTRQLETDYETLHTKYECLKTNYETILEENEKLKAEVFHLKQNRLSKDTEKPNLHPHEVKECSRATAQTSVPDINRENAESEAICFTKNNVAKVGNASTDVITQSSTMAPHDRSRFPGFNAMDLSETTVDDDSRTEFLRSDYNFPRIEDAYCHPPVGSFNYGFPIEDHYSLGFWSC